MSEDVELGVDSLLNRVEQLHTTSVRRGSDAVVAEASGRTVSHENVDVIRNHVPLVEKTLSSSQAKRSFAVRWLPAICPTVDDTCTSTTSWTHCSSRTFVFSPRRSVYFDSTNFHQRVFQVNAIRKQLRRLSHSQCCQLVVQTRLRSEELRIKGPFVVPGYYNLS